MIRLLVVSALVLGACGANEPAAESPTSVAAPASTSDVRPDLPEIAPFGQGGAQFTGPDGAVTCSCVLVADTREERVQGLMNLTDLLGHAGMVFVFEDDVSLSFTMSDTPMALSIGWYTNEGTRVSTADMDPCLDAEFCITYPASGPYRYAIEVPQGDLAAVGAVDGATFELVDHCDG